MTASREVEGGENLAKSRISNLCRFRTRGPTEEPKASAGSSRRRLQPLLKHFLDQTDFVGWEKQSFAIWGAEGGWQGVTSGLVG